MKNQIILTQDRRESCIGFDDEWLMISHEEVHQNIESLRLHTESFYKSGTNGYAKINLNAIKEIRYHENYPDFFLRYQLPEKPSLLKKYYFRIKDDAIRGQFCNELASICLLPLKVSETNRFIGLFANILLLLVSILFSYTAFYISSGGLTYHRRASVKLVSELLQHINPAIILTIGGIISLFIVYKIFRAYFYPSQSITYK